jgi:hypothetical protein
MTEKTVVATNVARLPALNFIVPQLPLVLRMVRGLLLFKAWLFAAGQKLLAEEPV